MQNLNSKKTIKVVWSLREFRATGYGLLATSALVKWSSRLCLRLPPTTFGALDKYLKPQKLWGTLNLLAVVRRDNVTPSSANENTTQFGVLHWKVGQQWPVSQETALTMNRLKPHLSNSQHATVSAASGYLELEHSYEPFEALSCDHALGQWFCSHKGGTSSCLQSNVHSIRLAPSLVLLKRRADQAKIVGMSMAIVGSIIVGSH